MASIPQGAFAAYKLRANKTTNNKDMTIARLTNGEEKQPPRYSNKKRKHTKLLIVPQTFMIISFSI